MKILSGFSQGWDTIRATMVNALDRTIIRRHSTDSMFNMFKNFYAAIDSGAELLVSRQNVMDVARMMDKITNAIASDA